TNLDARNFRIVSVPVAQAGDPSLWRDVVPHDPDVFIHDFEPFREFLAISERSGGLRKVRVQRWDGSGASHLEADDPAYTMQLGVNPELDTTRLRYVYSSLTTPATTYDYDFASGERALMKRE